MSRTISPDSINNVKGGRTIIRRQATSVQVSCPVFLVWLVVSNVSIALMTLLYGQQQDSLQTTTTTHLSFNHLNGDNFFLAREQSNGFLDDIPNVEWVEFYQRPALLFQPYRHADDPNQSSEKVPFWTFHNWDPYFSCPRLQKIGRQWVCDPDRIIINHNNHTNMTPTTRMANDDTTTSTAITTPCLIYALGDADEWLEGVNVFFGQSCEVHAFGNENKDRQIIETGVLRYHHYHQHEWLPGVDVSFRETKRRLGHDTKTVDILFIDCNGCEWNIFREVLEQHRQILLRTHDLPLKSHDKETKYGKLPALAASEFFDSFRSHGYVLFAKQVVSGTDECLETDWSFLRLDLSFSEHGQ